MMTISARSTDTELAELFQQWWLESYPIPPGNPAKMTHVAWARHLLNKINNQPAQQDEQ